MAQTKLDPIQILEKIRIDFAKSRCKTLEDAGSAIVWHVLYNAGQHLEGKLSVIHHSPIALLQGLRIPFPVSVETEDVAA